MTYERIGLQSISNVDVARNLEEVYVSIMGKRPSGETRRHYLHSPGNRHVRLSPSQARRLAYRLIEAASKVERKQDTYGFWRKK